MKNFKLRGGFKPIDEGIYLFYVDRVNAEQFENDGKVDFELIGLNQENHSKVKHRHFFNLYKQDGSENNGAYIQLSILLQSVLNAKADDEVDVEAATGKTFAARIEHNEYNNKKYPSFAEIRELSDEEQYLIDQLIKDTKHTQQTPKNASEDEQSLETNEETLADLMDTLNSVA